MMSVFCFSGLPRKCVLIATFVVSWTLAWALFAIPSQAAEPPSDEGTQAAEADEETGGIKKVEHPIMSAATYFSELGRGGYRIYMDNCGDCHGDCQVLVRVRTFFDPPAGWFF